MQDERGPRKPSPPIGAEATIRDGLLDRDVTIRDMPPVFEPAPSAAPQLTAAAAPLPVLPTKVDVTPKNADPSKTSTTFFDAVTQEAPTFRRPDGPMVSGAHHEEKLTPLQQAKAKLGDFLHRHHTKIWWLHTAYALSLGAFVATFSEKGFDHARFLTLSLALVWLLVVLFFRFFGTGSQQDFITAWPGARRRFFVMTYLMKNLFQGMLFFLLPIYFKSGSYDAHTIWIFCVLGGCALLSTLDLLFDRVLLRFKLVASLFFAVTLFGCMNVAIPALFSEIPTLVTLLVATGLAVATFFLFHIPLVTLKRSPVLVMFGVFVSAGIVSSYFGRRAIPAVPMYIKAGGVGFLNGKERELDFQVKTARADRLGDLVAVTDVSVIGHGDNLTHVWLRDGKPIEGAAVADKEVKDPTDKSLVRIASRLSEGVIKEKKPGHYTVDVETGSGQIVGRIAFDVTP